jgi:hypothetical protein
MKSPLILLALVLYTLNAATAIVAESSSSSSSIAIGADSSARSSASSVAVGHDVGPREPSTSIFTSKETSTYGNAEASAKATGKVTMNNPSSDTVAALRTDVTPGNEVSHSVGKSPLIENCARGSMEEHSSTSTSRSSDASFSAQTANQGTETFTFNIHGTITDVLTPSSILIGNEMVELNLGFINPSGLYEGNYELLMNSLKDKLIGKEVLVKDNYAYYDLNGAINTVSINEMIQKEVWGMLIEQ